MKRRTKQTASKNAAKKEMISLNDRLVSDFSIEELEARLETDPLMLLQVFGVGIQDTGNNDMEIDDNLQDYDRGCEFNICEGLCIVHK